MKGEGLNWVVENSICPEHHVIVVKYRLPKNITESPTINRKAQPGLCLIDQLTKWEGLGLDMPHPDELQLGPL